MKNLKKLTKVDLKKINGGNAPECPDGTIACLIPPKNGSPVRWRCTPVTEECPD
ncbi:bacteriocin-like protein [Chryseobacterium kwangjuense]|uniref:Bacteriocin-like protein n=1 Tax=Chryseobacterium kwangjuense TaxID=267125 RepID=A0ABW9JXI2_9FLAO